MVIMASCAQEDLHARWRSQLHPRCNDRHQQSCTQVSISKPLLASANECVPWLHRVYAREAGLKDVAILESHTDSRMRNPGTDTGRVLQKE